MTPILFKRKWLESTAIKQADQALPFGEPRNCLLGGLGTITEYTYALHTQ